MSEDVEAGIDDEESIPLVAIEGNGKAVYEKTRLRPYSSETSLHSNIKGQKDAGATREIRSDMIKDRNNGSTMKYTINICDEGLKGAFKFIKFKTEASADQIAKDAAKFLEIIGIKSDSLETLICVDDTDNISESGIELLRKVAKESPGLSLFLTNGLPGKIISNNHICDIVAVFSTSVVCGSGVTGTDNDTPYFGVLENLPIEGIGQDIRCVLLLEDASSFDILQYKLEITTAFLDNRFHCIKLIVDGSKEVLMSMDNGSYFCDRAGTLVAMNGGLLSSVLYAFVEACKNGSELPEQAQNDLMVVCREFLSPNDNIDIKLVIENIKQNILKFSTFDESKENIDDAIANAKATGLEMHVNFLMDTSKTVIQRMSNEQYFKNNITTLVFKNSGGFPLLVANYLQDCVYKRECIEQRDHFMKIGDLHNDDDFIENINNNISNLTVYDANANDLEPITVISLVSDFMGRLALEDNLLYLGASSTFKEFTLLEIMAALHYNQPEIFEKWLHRQIEIDTYVFCNLRFHWHDLDERGESKVAEYFGIPSKERKDNQRWIHVGRIINSAIEKLSNGIIADCFLEDGKPNVAVVSPMQALIINRIICLQFEFVKVLWKYDKQNVLVNSVIIWILINGILNKKIFSREAGTDDLNNAKDYFGKAIKKFLDQLIVGLPEHHLKVLKFSVAIFRGKALYHVAGDGKFVQFLTHTVTKRCISVEWNNEGKSEKESMNFEHVADSAKATYRNFIRKPKMKLFIHMIMYVISFLLLAYYTLQQNKKSIRVLRWILFTMMTSLFVDEIRQALGEKQCTLKTSLINWWSDSWNKLDFLSMMLYYIAFCLECVSIINASRLLLSTFTFIWCLKFYQFLRAFKSLGTYIILVQKMLPQLSNFAIVAVIAIVSYGVFMTSILFPDIKFGSWSIFIMVLLRPYLLLFAETGINEYDLSSKNTIYNTPKVERASEMLAVVGMCAFLMFGGVLLLNLLIAIFSGIYEEVKEQSERLWALNDLQLLQEFQLKPSVPIPFSLPFNIYLILKRVFAKVEVYAIADGESDLVLKIMQQFVAENVIRSEKYKEPNSDPVNRSRDSQITELCQRCKAVNLGLENTLHSQRDEYVKEIQQIYERCSQDMHYRASNAEKCIEEVLSKHKVDDLKLMGEKVQEMTSSEDDIVKLLKEYSDNADKSTALLSARMEEMENKIEDLNTIIEKKLLEAIRKNNATTNERIDRVEIQCQEILEILKQLSAKEKEK